MAPLFSPKNDDPVTVEDVPTRGEKITRYAGLGMQTLAGLPRILDTQDWVTEAFKLHDAMPLIHHTAAAAGVLGTAGLGGSGAIQAIHGLKNHNSAEVLSGASEVARGLYVGAWTESWELGPLSAQGAELHALGNTLSLVSGGLMVAAGLARMTHKAPPGSTVKPRVVGALEAGMGATWMAAFVGVHPAICIGARAGLNIARSYYVNSEKIDEWRDRIWRHQKPIELGLNQPK